MLCVHSCSHLFSCLGFSVNRIFEDMSEHEEQYLASIQLPFFFLKICDISPELSSVFLLLLEWNIMNKITSKEKVCLPIISYYSPSRNLVELFTSDPKSRLVSNDLILLLHPSLIFTYVVSFHPQATWLFQHQLRHCSIYNAKIPSLRWL